MSLYYWLCSILSQQSYVPPASPVTFRRPWIFFGDAGEAQVSMATRLLHHYSPAAVVKLVFGQALRQPNSDSTHSSHTHTHCAAHAKTLTLNSFNQRGMTICSNIPRFLQELVIFIQDVFCRISRTHDVFKTMCVQRQSATSLKRPVFVCLSHYAAVRF